MVQHLSDIPEDIVGASPVLQALDKSEDVELPVHIPIALVNAYVREGIVAWTREFFLACQFYCLDKVEEAIRTWVRIHGHTEGAREKVEVAVESGYNIGEVLEWFEEDMGELEMYTKGLLFRVQKGNLRMKLCEFAYYGHLDVVRYLVEECEVDATLYLI